MSSQVDTGTKTYPSGAALGQHLRVKLGSDGLLTLAGATDLDVGTVAAEVFAANVSTAVNLHTKQGTRKMIASGAITCGDPVYAAASGKVASSGTLMVGIAQATVTTNGDVIEVMDRSSVDISTSIAGTTNASFTVDSDSSAAKVAVNTNSATGNFTATIVPPNLSGNVTITLPGATGTLATNTPVTEAHTAGDTLLAAESGSIHTSVGASGTVTLVLPAATVGQHFYFRVGAAQELRLDPNGSETIALPSTGVAGAGGKYLTANADGETVHLVCTKAGEWSVMGYTGTWTAEP